MNKILGVHILIKFQFSIKFNWVLYIALKCPFLFLFFFENNIVLSTTAVCDELFRKYIGMEITWVYCVMINDVICVLYHDKWCSMCILDDCITVCWWYSPNSKNNFFPCSNILTEIYILWHRSYWPLSFLFRDI